MHIEQKLENITNAFYNPISNDKTYPCEYCDGFLIYFFWLGKDLYLSHILDRDKYLIFKIADSFKDESTKVVQNIEDSTEYSLGSFIKEYVGSNNIFTEVFFYDLSSENIKEISKEEAILLAEDEG